MSFVRVLQPLTCHRCGRTEAAGARFTRETGQVRQHRGRVCSDCGDKVRAEYNRRHACLVPPEVRTALHEAQRGICAICQRPPRRRGLALDHDHTTRLVRGLLCQQCNNRLGYLERRGTVKLADWRWLLLARDYLVRPPAVEVVGAVRVRDPDIRPKRVRPQHATQAP